MRLRNALGAAALVVASLLFCALALELGLRLFWTGHYLNLPKANVQPHPVRGWANRPSVAVTYGEAEFHHTVTTNALGFRSAELAPRQGDRKRVLVLGDSFAYGIGVADDETFSARLAALEPGLEVLNAGVNGYGPGQELLLLREVGLGVEPDLVLLAFFWNDVPDVLQQRFPRFSLQDGRLVDPPPRAADDPELARWPEPGPPPRFQDSRARRFVKDRAYKARWRLRVALGIPVESPSGLDAEQRAHAFELCFALLREMDALSRGAGARFAIALIPDQVQVYPELFGRVLGIDPADYEVQAPLAAFARAEEIPLVDLLPALRAAREADPETPLYYRMDRHLTAAGHRVVSEALRDALHAHGLTGETLTSAVR